MSTKMLVNQGLDYIDEHNGTLKALISTVSRENVSQVINDLDQERATKGPRGPLHGLPIVVKDTFCSPSVGLPTTCGSFALKDAVATSDATVVQRLVDAGLVIIGKTNVTAFGKASKAGWSAPGGQTRSPYIKATAPPGTTFQDHDSPSGSSSGSAVAVAASFALMAISAETEESTVSPSGRAGIFGLKATHGSIPMDGIQPYSPGLDCVGVMAQVPDIILPVLNCLQDVDKDVSAEVNFMQKGFDGLQIGVVDSNLWTTDKTKTPFHEEFAAQVHKATEAALQTVKSSGGSVTRNVVISSYDDLTSGLLNIDQIVEHDFGPSQKKFLSGFKTNPAKVTNLEEWVAYNAANLVELPADHPSQAGLEACIRPTPNATEEQRYATDFANTRKRAQDAIDRALMHGHDNTQQWLEAEGKRLDVILGPADSKLAAVASLAGYPIACMPLGRWTEGQQSNGRCFGIYAISTTGRPGEEMLLRVMKAWEQHVRKFEAPSL